MFSENEKSTFPYWFAHWSAYQMIALNLRVWKAKYLFHDWEKPWMLLFAKGLKKIGLLKQEPYEWVRAWHKTHRKHHRQYYIPATMLHSGRMPNIREMIIDWECSRFTKSTFGRTAYEYYRHKQAEIPMVLQFVIEQELKTLGLWES